MTMTVTVTVMVMVTVIHLADAHGDSGYLPRRPRVPNAVAASGGWRGRGAMATSRAPDGHAGHAGGGERAQHLRRKRREEERGGLAMGRVRVC